MTDISGFGLRIQVKASITFPAGFNVTQFADDGDPFDIPNIQIADKAMGLNGDMITWSTANPIIFTLSAIPGTEDDKNLTILFEANRVGKGKTGARDEITVTGIYPSGSTITLSPCAITDGPPGMSVASAGRLKTNAYSFAAENVSKS